MQFNQAGAGRCGAGLAAAAAGRDRADHRAAHAGTAGCGAARSAAGAGRGGAGKAEHDFSGL